MNLQQDSSNATYQINRYEPGKIWINQKKYEQSILLRAHELIIWHPSILSDLTKEHFALLLENKPSILLLGTGEKMLIPSQKLLDALTAEGIGVEFMDNRRACYTYTVLAAEQRNVAACILI